MKPSILRVLLFALTASPGITPAAETNPPGDIAASVANAIDWPAFMARQDMHFNRALTDWTQAPHFGNASIGSMLCQAGRVVRLQIFRADIQGRATAIKQITPAAHVIYLKKSEEVLLSHK